MGVICLEVGLGKEGAEDLVREMRVGAGNGKSHHPSDCACPSLQKEIAGQWAGMPPPVGTTEGPQEVLLCSSLCTISRGPDWYKGRLRVASERVRLRRVVLMRPLPPALCSASSCPGETRHLELRRLWRLSYRTP